MLPMPINLTWSSACLFVLLRNPRTVLYEEWDTRISFSYFISSEDHTQAGNPKCHTNNSGRWEQSNHGQLESHSLCGASSNPSGSWFVPQANPPGEGSWAHNYFWRVLILLEKLARCAPLHLFFCLFNFYYSLSREENQALLWLNLCLTKIPPTLCPKVKDWAARCTGQVRGKTM